MVQAILRPSINFVRLHLTNVTGMGAIQVLNSLLPYLQINDRYVVSDIYLPDAGPLSIYRPFNKITKVTTYYRFIQKSFSRLIECTFLSYKFDGSTPLFVFGDLPLRTKSRQIVFMQTSHMIPPAAFEWGLISIKFIIMRMVFRANLHYAQTYIVQTNHMREALINAYPTLFGRVHVVYMPVPSWLINCQLKRTSRVTSGVGLSLIYPSMKYLHKNHNLLSYIDVLNDNDWQINKLLLTIESKANPAPCVSWIRCVGRLSIEEMIDNYAFVDALVFLSTNESYGLPLVEAMFVGLPVICPDLPYAKDLCGKEAIYFNPVVVSSLKDAVIILHNRLATGWWPDWSDQLSRLPPDWNTVACKFLALSDTV
jgi:glycosyltransferase involved in cell wall biosynthesis